MGYRAGCTGCEIAKATGTATGDAAETEYMVTTKTAATGDRQAAASTTATPRRALHDDGTGTMEALHFGEGVVWGTGSPGSRNNGPWVMADLENGIFAGWENNQDQGISTNTPLNHAFRHRHCRRRLLYREDGLRGHGLGESEGRFALLPATRRRAS